MYHSHLPVLPKPSLRAITRATFLASNIRLREIPAALACSIRASESRGPSASCAASHCLSLSRLPRLPRPSVARASSAVVEIAPSFHSMRGWSSIAMT